MKSYLIQTISSKYSHNRPAGSEALSASKGQGGSFHVTSLLEKRKKAKQNADLIRVVYLFWSKRVFAFVAFIPILPASGALEDELPRNTKF